MVDRLGLVHIYTGNGKGKTTAALGQVVRAAGRGWSCYVLQLMKGGVQTGETAPLTGMKNVTIESAGANFLAATAPSMEEVRQGLLAALETARPALNGLYDLVVIDEAVTAVGVGAVRESELIELLKSKDSRTELILTGRGAGKRLIEAADLVTEMVEIKHPFNEGVRARKGIEL